VIKRKMSLLLAAVVVATGVGTVTPAFAETTAQNLPSIYRAVPSISMAEEGDDFTFAVTAKDYEGQVQYRIWVQNLETQEWSELTDGYSEAVDAGQPFMPEAATKLKAGKYKASIWVKRAGQKGAKENKNGDYDNYFTKNFSIQKDGYFANRVNLDNVEIKDSYTVNEFAKIVGQDNYKIHVLNSKGEWTYDPDGYETAEDSSDDIKFVEPGVYMIDVWGMNDNPTDAVKKQGYDGFKLKIVTVTEAPVDEIPTFEVITADTNAIPMQTLVQIKLDTTTPENYEVKVAGTALELRTNKDGEKVFIGVVNKTLTKDQVIENTEVTKIGDEDKEIPAHEIVTVDTNAIPMQTLVQIKLDTTTPEKYTVEVAGTALELRTNKDGEKVFIGVVNKTLTQEQVEAQLVIK